MKKILLMITVALLLVIITTVIDKKALTKVLEQAYFEGQKDAINGDIRIKLNSDSIYVWTKSPWESGEIPVYVPTYLDSKK